MSIKLGLKSAKGGLSEETSAVSVWTPGGLIASRI